VTSNEPTTAGNRLWYLGLSLFSGISVLIGIITFRTNLLDLYSFRQTQTAFTIREFMMGNWSISSPLPVLGPPWSVPFEFPLFQAIAALIGNVFHLAADSAGRVAGLAFFIATGLLLAILIRRWFGTTAALLTLVFFQFTPFGVQWSTASLIEFAATTFVLGAIVVIDSYSRNNSWILLSIATALLTLGFMVKVTSAFAWALVFLVAAFGLSGRSVPTWKPLLSGFAPLAIALGATLAWTRWADSIKEQNPFASYLTSSALREWNFGTLGQRFNIDQ